MEDETSDEILAHTAEIVAAYVSHQSIAMADLPNVIGSVFKTLRRTGQVEEPAPAARPEPAVPIRKSVTETFLVCLEDGKKVKMLKRYLRTRYNLTPNEYRQRWGLSADYPMVAPAYAEQRSALAKMIGLGRKPAAQPAPMPPVPEEPKRRAAGRRKVA
jgi:predicted transcriptional regulator